MERINLRVTGLQLIDLSSCKDEENLAWMTLKLCGAFSIEGIRAGYEDNGGFHQIWGNVRTRLLDVPLLHKNEKNKNNPPLLLEYIAAKAIRDYFWKNDSKMRNLLKRKINGINLEEFIPEEWHNQSLIVPVDFIKIRGFNCYQVNGDVYASIQIGHHLIMFHVRIYRGSEKIFCLNEDAIIDERLRKEIMDMLEHNAALGKHILRLSIKGIGDINEEFIEKTESCNPESIPPPISFVEL